MSGLYNVSSSPHVRGADSTQRIMFDVAVALIPAAGFGVVQFGLYSLLVLLVSVAFAILTEYVFQKLAKQPVTVSDGSALVTGLLLGMNLPPSVPIWIPALGSIFAILVVKQFFGGIGQNFMNPALGARCFLLISFTGIMSDYVLDGVSTATPLALMKNGETPELLSTFLGTHAGCIGEVSALAILIGAAYLLIRKVITWEIPVCYIVSFVIFEILFGGHGFDPVYLLTQVCSGGLLLGAFFMATDYATSPITKNGKYLFGILLGVLTGILRIFGASAEGVSYAIIISNLLVPLIERITMPVAYGFKHGSLEGKQKVSLRTYKAALTLCAITLVAGLALGAAYQATKEPIALAELAAQAEAYRAVAPGSEEFEPSAELQEAAAGITAEDGTVAEGQFGGIRFEDVLNALDASGNKVGYVVNVTSKDGFGGEMTLSLGVDLEGVVTGLEFLTINETAGLGMNAKEESFRNQYLGTAVDSFSLVKEAPSADNEIQAISGATITSTAVTNAVNAALYLVSSVQG